MRIPHARRSLAPTIFLGLILFLHLSLLAQDTVAPSVPTGLNGYTTSSTQINLTWSNASDNIGVSGYRIFRNGTQVATSTVIAYSDTGLNAATLYTYRVVAVDAANNASAQSTAITVTTDGATESVHTLRRRFVSPITPAIKANLRSIKQRGDALGRQAGILGQWGDSITNSNAYLGAIASWQMIVTPPIDGHNYTPILLWLGATPGAATGPLTRFKGPYYCNESGWRVSNGLDAIDDAILRSNPSLSLTMYGTNDIRSTGWNPANYEILLERFLRLNIDAGIVPGISTIPPCVGYDAKVDQANVVIRRVAARMNLPLVDLHDLYTTLHPTDWDTVLLSDGVHPSWTNTSGNLSETPQRNDGYNLRTMLTLDLAEKIKHIVFENGPAEGSPEPIILIRSSTHPDKNIVAAAQASFQFLADSGPAPTAYSWTLDQNAYTVPDTIADGTDATIAVPIPQPGSWYLHARANSAEGWGPAVHYPLTAANDPTVDLRHNDEPTALHQDTMISGQWGGNDNYGGASNLNLYNSDRPYGSRALFRFNVSGAPATGLQSATLILHTELPATVAYNYQAFNVTSSWIEGTGTGSGSGVTWNTSPTFASTAFASGTLALGQSVIELDVTALARTWLADAAVNNGIMLQHDRIWTELHLLTREYGARNYRPLLQLRYAATTDTIAPSSPAALAATANGSAGANLSWTAATDNVGVTGYRIYRNAVLIGTSTGTTYADTGLEPATTFSYNIKAIDAAGNEGPAASTAYTTPTPAVYLGPDRTIVLPSGASLDAAITGLTTPYTIAWTQLSGPGTARIVFPANPYSAVYFPQAGTYRFRCTVTADTSTNTDDITFTVQAAPTSGRTVNVNSVTQLRAAINAAQSNDTILLADGTYDLTAVTNGAGGTWLTLNNVRNVVLQSASNNPTAVTISGNGFTGRGDNADGIWIQRCQCITVRALTFYNFGAYAIKLEANLTPLLEDIRIESCRFLSIGMRCIKGTTVPVPGTDFVHRGWIQNCLFENTALPPTVGSYSGDYIAGLDLMCLSNWEFKDNAFLNIRGETAGGRAAIFLWNYSRGAVIERNTITGCDRGIAFGNPSGTAAVHCSWSVARNNLIIVQRADAYIPDEPIELALVQNIKIHHNTVWRTDYTRRGIRCSAAVSGVDIANNLVRGQFDLLTGATPRKNLFGNLSSALFANSATGNFHLVATATSAINAGATDLGVTTDITGNPRDAQPDLGAYEYDWSSILVAPSDALISFTVE